LIWKPLGYVANGWQHIVTPAIPKRVLNLYLQQPRQRVYRLDLRYVAAHCQRRLLYSQHQPAGPLNAADVSNALRLLVQLGLFVPAENGFRLDWPTFNRPAPASPARFANPNLREHHLFVELFAIDPIRAERALELVLVGNYEIDLHFADIFYDLAYIHQEDDYCLLRHKAYTRRNRLPGPQRWKETWRVFHSELKRRAAEIRFPKVILKLDRATHSAAALAVNLSQVKRSVSAVSAIARLEYPWYLQEMTPVQLDVLARDRVLFTRTLGFEDGEVRFMLPPDQWVGIPAALTLQARCERPLPGVQVEAWIEAKLQR
jgi:hypothetical protein